MTFVQQTAEEANKHTHNISKGVKKQMIEVRMKKGEQIDRALRRLKKKLDKEGVLKEIRNRRHFEKPSEKRRRAERRPRMTNSI